MSKYFKLNSFSLFFAIIFLLSFSNNDAKNNHDTSTIKAKTIATTRTIGTGTDALAGTLNLLYVETSAFDQVPNGRKLVLSFTFRDPDTLTLYGWACKNRNCSQPFDDTAVIKLKKGAASEDAYYGPNVIFGDVIIARKDIIKIKNKYGTTFDKVVFVPLKKVDEFIRYRIYVTSDDAKTKPFKALALEDTGVETNPSPPKI